MNLKSIQDRMSSTSISLKKPNSAPDLINFIITYKAGFFGIDDTVSIKIYTRFATGMWHPQFTNPEKFNYLSIKPSNDSILA